MTEFLDRLAALTPGQATIAAAVVAGVITLVVTFVNGWNSRRLEATKALREHRGRIAAEIETYTKRVLNEARALHTIADPLEDEQRLQRLQDWLTTFAETQAIPQSFFVTGVLGQKCFKTLRQTQLQVDDYLKEAVVNPSRWNRTNRTDAIRYARVVRWAGVGVQMACEVYVHRRRLKWLLTYANCWRVRLHLKRLRMRARSGAR